MAEEAGGAATQALTGGETTAQETTAQTEQTTTQETTTQTETTTQGDTGHWYGDIADEQTRGWLETKNWESLEEMAASHKNLEGLRGVPESELARLPKAEDAEGFTKLAQRLGMPEKADGYELEGVGEEGAGLREIFHRHNLTQKQAEGIFADFQEFDKAGTQAQQEAFYRQSEQDMGELKKDWGAAYEEKIDVAKAARTALGLSGEQILAIERAVGTKTVMNMLATYGTKTGEMPAIEGGDGNERGFRRMTPEGAKSAYDQWNADPDNRERLMSRDRRIRDAAIAERAQLSSMAFDH